MTPKLSSPVTADMVRLSASEVACYRWPEDTAEHRAMRAAFCDGAVYGIPAQSQPSREAIATAIYQQRRSHYRDRVAFSELYPSAQREYLEEADAVLALTSTTALPPLVDRAELIALLQDLASVNLSPEACARQARRMADDLIARGVFVTSTVQTPIENKDGGAS